MPKGTIAIVREGPGTTPPPNSGRMLRLVIRLDLYNDIRKVDYSIVGWRHPEARVVINTQSLNNGGLQFELVHDELRQYLAEWFDELDDPFF